jgi:hypothetical protein
MSLPNQPKLLQDSSNQGRSRVLSLHVVKAVRIPVLPNTMADGTNQPIEPFPILVTEPRPLLRSPALNRAIRRRNLEI